MRRAFIAVAVVALVSAVMVTSAFAVTSTYRGRTSQGYKTVAKVEDGVLQMVNVPWIAHCRKRGFRFGPIRPFRWTNHPDAPIEQDGETFTDSGRIIDRRGSEKSVITAHLEGRISGDRISGTQNITVRVRDKHGRDYCKARVRWSAKLASR